MDKSRKDSSSNVEADPAHDLKNSESEENEKFEATSGKAESKDYLKTIVNQKKQTKDVLKVARVTRFSDLPLDLVGGKILTKVPITSLGAVRSTCKSWEALSRDWILSKAAAAARRQFFGFMTMNCKLYSLRFDLRKDKDKEVDHSMKRVDIFNQVTISKVFHCDGLLLCVPKDNSSLVVCNPYLGQTRWIEHRTKVHKPDRYALGYDKNGNHKILKFTDGYDPKIRNLCLVLEIYELSSRSWRVLDITSDWEIDYNPLGASLKGNTYFFAQEGVLTTSDDGEDCLVCFDFTNERFGPRLPLPFHSCSQKAGELSCVRDEQLAVLYQPLHTSEILEFWVTIRIEPNAVAWSKFLTVDMRPHTRYLSGIRTFFIDQEEKVAVVFMKTGCHHSAFIIGDDGYFKSVGLGKCRMYCYPSLVCSSFYLPSLVQVT